MKRINSYLSNTQRKTSLLLLLLLLTFSVKQASASSRIIDLPDGYMGGYLHTKQEITNIVNNAPWWIFVDPVDNGDPSPSTLPGTTPSFAGLTNYVMITLQQTGFSTIYENRQFLPGMDGASYLGYKDAYYDFMLAMSVSGFRY